MSRGLSFFFYSSSHIISGMVSALNTVPMNTQPEA